MSSNKNLSSKVDNLVLELKILYTNTTLLSAVANNASVLPPVLVFNRGTWTAILQSAFNAAPLFANKNRIYLEAGFNKLTSIVTFNPDFTPLTHTGIILTANLYFQNPGTISHMFQNGTLTNVALIAELSNALQVAKDLPYTGKLTLVSVNAYMKSVPVKGDLLKDADLDNSNEAFFSNLTKRN